MDDEVNTVRHDTRVDVGSVAGEGPFELAATVILAPERVGQDAPVVLVCWPGGSYDRRYWDLQPSAGQGFSAAEHWARDGYVVVTADHLGVGDSDKPADGDAVRIASMADAAAGLVSSVRAMLAAGQLHPSLPALDGVRIVGVGHSLGGSMVITQQARHESYDAVAAIGITQGAKGAVEIPEGADATDPEAIALAQADAFFGGALQSYGRPLKAGSRAWLYGPNDDQEVVDEDVDVRPVWPRGPYVEALMPAQTVDYAARVESPLLLCFSEIDIPESPRQEPAYFTACNDITLFLLPDAAHCSNFSPNRVVLWDRISTWERSLHANRD